MKEAQFQTLWHKHLEENPPDFPEVYELKICKTRSFAFSGVKEHQIEGLLKAKTGLFHKISDSPIFSGMKTRFTAKKPFDCLWIRGEGYVAILFYVPRKAKRVVKINVDDFLKMVKSHNKKSATLEEMLSYGGELITL